MTGVPGPVGDTWPASTPGGGVVPLSLPVGGRIRAPPRVPFGAGDAGVPAAAAGEEAEERGNEHERSEAASHGDLPPGTGSNRAIPSPEMPARSRVTRAGGAKHRRSGRTEQVSAVRKRVPVVDHAGASPVGELLDEAAKDPEAVVTIEYD